MTNSVTLVRRIEEAKALVEKQEKMRQIAKTASENTYAYQLGSK